MNILVTGADRPLGALAASHLRDRHRVQLTGAAPTLDGDLSGISYCKADLREPDQTSPLVQGIDAVLHLDPYDPAPVSSADAEQERLDIAARGTYVLLKEARKAGVDRGIVASTLGMFEAYPEEFNVNETWQPQPPARAEALAPMMSDADRSRIRPRGRHSHRLPPLRQARRSRRHDGRGRQAGVG